MNKQLRTDILLKSWDTFTISAVSRINIQYTCISSQDVIPFAILLLYVQLVLESVQDPGPDRHIYIYVERDYGVISLQFFDTKSCFFVTTYQLVSLLYFLLPKNWNVQSWWQNNEKSGFNTFLRIHCSVRLFTSLRYRVVAQYTTYMCIYISTQKILNFSVLLFPAHDQLIGFHDWR